MWEFAILEAGNPGRLKGGKRERGVKSYALVQLEQVRDVLVACANAARPLGHMLYQHSELSAPVALYGRHLTSSDCNRETSVQRYGLLEFVSGIKMPSCGC